MPNDLPKSGIPNTIPAPPTAKAPSIESIGQKVVRRLKDQTNRLMDRLGKSDDTSYGVIHEALLHAWTDGHDDASTSAVRMVDEAHEVTMPSKARMARCGKRDSNGVQCEISGPHRRCAAPKALAQSRESVRNKRTNDYPPLVGVGKGLGAGAAGAEAIRKDCRDLACPIHTHGSTEVLAAELSKAAKAPFESTFKAKDKARKIP